MAQTDDPEAGTANSSRPHDPYLVLRNGDYRRFLVGGMAATIGGQMQRVAVGWELYERTRSPTAWGWSAWRRCSR